MTNVLIRERPREFWNIHTEKTHVCVLSTQLDKCSHYFILVIWINRSLYTAWCWERWRAGREDDDRGWDGWIASPIPWTWVWANWEIVKDREVWRAAVHVVSKSQTKLSNLLLGRKAMTNLDSILKSRVITLPTKSSQSHYFSSSQVWMWRKLNAEELMLLNHGVGGDSWDCLGQQGDQTSASQRKSVLNIHWKDWCWSWNSNTLATWCKELTHWKRPWCLEMLKAGGEGDDRGWDGCMASSIQWTGVWVSSGSWWWTGRPGMLQSMGSQRVGHDWATELNWNCILTNWIMLLKQP